MVDAALIDAIAEFIARYRLAQAPPQKTLEAVLAEFPAASASDFAIGLGEANRRRAAK